MRKLCTVTILLACLCGCKLFRREPEPNVLTTDEEVNGWELLWDGESLTNGWAGVSAGCTTFTARGWSVTNGMLVAAAGADPIRTTAAFKDFDLKVDYRLAPGASACIRYFHNAETNVDTSAVYKLTPLSPEALEDDPDAWQTARIVARRKFMTHWLDGKIIDRPTREEVERAGRVVLEPQGGKVEFRNVKVHVFGKW